MSAAPAADAVRIVRESPGRLRLHLAGWDGGDPDGVARSLSDIPGVLEASARPATSNALLRFDERRTDSGAILSAVGALAPSRLRTAAARRRQRPSAEPPDRSVRQTVAAKAGRTAASVPRIGGVLREHAGRFGRARIPVPGIDRDPKLAQRVVEVLERRPDVQRAVASATTGRVLVEFSERVTSIQDVVSELAVLVGEGGFEVVELRRIRVAGRDLVELYSTTARLP